MGEEAKVWKKCHARLVAQARSSYVLSDPTTVYKHFVTARLSAEQSLARASILMQASKYKFTV